MKIKIQIKSIYGKPLFEFEKENNTIKDTILEAINSLANLSSANLSSANLSSANLSSTNLSAANLSSADIKRYAQLFSILPGGELIVWKKLQNNLIAKLLIPEKAKRVNCFGSRKCRFEYAKVICIYQGRKKVNSGHGQYNNNLIYKVGQIIKSDKYDPSPLIECSHGIHAFITRLEAEEYN